MLTMDFLKSVLIGDKNLLFVKETYQVDKIPRYPEIHVPTLWNDLKADQKIVKYFPDSFVTKKRIPDRTFMMTVD